MRMENPRMETNKMANKILIADDMDNIRDCYKRIFNISDEYSILEARNGDELVRLYENSLLEAPKVIVTDKDMPSEDDGLTAARKIRGLPKGLETTIILISGHLTGNEKADNNEKFKDVNYTFSKPVDIFKVKELIDKVYKKINY